MYNTLKYYPSRDIIPIKLITKDINSSSLLLESSVSGSSAYDIADSSVEQSDELDGEITEAFSGIACVVKECLPEQ